MFKVITVFLHELEDKLNQLEDDGCDVIRMLHHPTMINYEPRFIIVYEE